MLISTWGVLVSGLFGWVYVDNLLFNIIRVRYLFYLALDCARGIY